MKAVILAGGLGTRISEETHLKPKPMIEIGGKPILWHIMKLYSGHGVNDFVICCGYKGYLIKEYFANYFLHMSDVTFDMQRNTMDVHHRNAEPWKVTLVDTGEQTLTGGRLKQVARYIQDEPEFCFTYGDGLTDLDITGEIAYHRKHGKWDRGAAAGPLRCLTDDRQRSDRFHRKASRRRRSNQRWFFCAFAQVPRSDRGRRNQLGERAAEQTRPRKATDGVGTFWFLAADGYASG